MVGIYISATNILPPNTTPLVDYGAAGDGEMKWDAAISYCNTQSVNGVAAHIPTLEEGRLWCPYYNKISQIGGADALDDHYYWTTNEYNASNAYRFYCSVGAPYEDFTTKDAISVGSRCTYSCY